MSKDKKRILIFDEEVDLTNAIRENFEFRNHNIQVDAVHTYTKALEMISNRNYDVLLLDVIIPFTQDEKDNFGLTDHNNTGLDFLEHISKMEENGQLVKPKVVLFSARKRLPDHAEVAFTLSKPMKPRSVLNKVEEIV